MHMDANSQLEEKIADSDESYDRSLLGEYYRVKSIRISPYGFCEASYGASLMRKIKILLFVCAEIFANHSGHLFLKVTLIL